MCPSSGVFSFCSSLMCSVSPEITMLCPTSHTTVDSIVYLSSDRSALPDCATG